MNNNTVMRVLTFMNQVNEGVFGDSESNQKEIIEFLSSVPDFGDFVEFDNDIEEELYSEKRERKNYKNKPFNALKTVSEENYIIPAQLEKKIRKIFS